MNDSSRDDPSLPVMAAMTPGQALAGDTLDPKEALSAVGFFSSRSPLWIFFFCTEDKKLSGLLSWLDLWHSGLFSRSFAPYVRGQKSFPDHFLFLPQKTPAPNGILVVPYGKGKASDKLALLPDTLMGLSAEQVMIDHTSLPVHPQMEIHSPTVLSTPDLLITIRCGQKEDEPATFTLFHPT